MSFTLPTLTTELRLSELERNAAEDRGHLIADSFDGLKGIMFRGGE